MTMFQSVCCEYLASASTLHCPSVDPVLHDSIGPNCMLVPALRIYSTPDPELALGIREEHHRAPLGEWGEGTEVSTTQGTVRGGGVGSAPQRAGGIREASQGRTE